MTTPRYAVGQLEHSFAGFKTTCFIVLDLEDAELCQARVIPPGAVDGRFRPLNPELWRDLQESLEQNNEAIFENPEDYEFERVEDYAPYLLAVDDPESTADDRDLNADELEQKYSPHGGGEHPDFPREDWREMVRIEDTLLGYWAWVHHALTTEKDDPL